MKLRGWLLVVAMMLLAMASGVAMLLRRALIWTDADEAALADEERWFEEYSAGDVDWNETGEVVA